MFLKLLIVFLIIAPLAFCMGIPFPAGLFQISKHELSVDTMGLGNKRCCVCDKHRARYYSGSGIGIYMGNVVCGVSVLPAIICTGKNGTSNVPWITLRLVIATSIGRSFYLGLSAVIKKCAGEFDR